MQVLQCGGFCNLKEHGHTLQNGAKAIRVSEVLEQSVNNESQLSRPAPAIESERKQKSATSTQKGSVSDVIVNKITWID